jgi:sugar (pentulose or hexulose) kinase
MAKEVVLIFDIGKTNKKILLFDSQLNLLHEEETVFKEIPDDDGFYGDDMERLETWILDACFRYLNHERYLVRGINFTTYGASLIYLNEDGERLTPIYNYLKPMPEGIVEPLYEAFGGESEFCRKTASPALGMLNSGFQALWLKKKKPKVFNQVKSILHFPQYLSFLLTGIPSTEHTSIGCHTGLWDFENMCYHPWTKQLGPALPEPEAVETTYPSTRFKFSVPVGIGIHDSSSSLVPYFMNSTEKFILISTGTWCISMNPFNREALTAGQLKQDCLAFLSMNQQAVISSRFFLGRIHDENLIHLNKLYGRDKSAYKAVVLDKQMLHELRLKHGEKGIFFQGGVPEAFVDPSIPKTTFLNFEEAYHQLIMDLVHLTVQSIRLIISTEDHTKNLFISGGFSKNPIFLYLIACSFPDKCVFTSEIANATSLGAAMVLWKGITPGTDQAFDLGLIPVSGEKSLS